MRKISSFKIGITLVVLSIFLVVSIALAASVGIDTFDDGAQIMSVDQNTPSLFGFANGSMVGGQRDISLTLFGGTGPVAVSVDQFNNNKFTLAQNPSALSRTVITWDGTDDNAVLDPAGISAFDLTDSGNNQGLHFEVTFDDKPVNIIFRYYSGSLSAYDEYVLALPGGIDSTGHVDYYIPFANFNHVSGGADVTSVQAVRMIVDASNTLSEGADVSIDFFEADDFRDLGDLPPNDYGTPTHWATGLRLGTSIDIEDPANYLLPAWGTTDATSDDLDGYDDEDGVVRTPGVDWTGGANGGSIDVVVTECNGTCYLNAWIDWQTNQDFISTNVLGSGVNDQIFNDYAITSGSHTLTFDVPPTLVGGGSSSDFLVRFRLCDSTGECNTPGGEAISGEVEDYHWGFGPTSVSMTSFTAKPSISPELVVSLAGISFLAVIALAVVFQMRRREVEK